MLVSLALARGLSSRSDALDGADAGLGFVRQHSREPLVGERTDPSGHASELFPVTGPRGDLFGHAGDIWNPTYGDIYQNGNPSLILEGTNSLDAMSWLNDGTLQSLDSEDELSGEEGAIIGQEGPTDAERRAEEERLARLEDERLARLEDERLAQIEAERVAQLAEDERLAQLAEVERLAKIAEDERRAQLAENERLAQLEADELRAKLEADRVARVAEVERLAKIEEEEHRAKLAEKERRAKLKDDEHRAKLAEKARLAKLADDERLAKLAEEERLAKLARLAEERAKLARDAATTADTAPCKWGPWEECSCRGVQQRFPTSEPPEASCLEADMTRPAEDAASACDRPECQELDDSIDRSGRGRKVAAEAETKGGTLKTVGYGILIGGSVLGGLIGFHLLGCELGQCWKRERSAPA